MAASGEPNALSEAKGLLLGGVALAALCLALAPRLVGGPLAVLGAVLFLFRDPPRSIRHRPGEVLAPADGRVIGVRRVHDEHWQTEMQEVQIFLSLLEPHLQRSPMPGQVEAIIRTPGSKRAANDPRVADANERVLIAIRGVEFPCSVVQIAGLVARRVVTWVSVGQPLEAGQKLGLIKLGSQVTVRLPLEADVRVRVGERVRAGLDLVAVYPLRPD